MAAANFYVRKNSFKIKMLQKTEVFFCCLLCIAVAHAGVAKTKTTSRDNDLNKEILFNELDAKNAGKFLDWVYDPEQK